MDRTSLLSGQMTLVEEVEETPVSFTVDGQNISVVAEEIKMDVNILSPSAIVNTSLTELAASTAANTTEVLTTEVLITEEVRVSDNVTNAVALALEPVDRPGEAAAGQVVVDEEKQITSVIDVAETNNDGALSLPKSVAVGDQLDSLGSERSSTDLETFKIEHKLAPGDEVEACSMEEGLRGAWFSGRIKEISGVHALIQFHELLEDDEVTKLEEWYPIGPPWVISLLENGKPAHEKDIQVVGGLKALTRQLRPISTVTPFGTGKKRKARDEDPVKPSAGDQIEVHSDEAWWAAVVIGVKGRTINVHYPEENVYDIAKLTAARPGLVFENGFWVINKQKITLDILKPSDEEPSKKRQKVVKPNRSKTVKETAKKTTIKKPAKNPAAGKPVVAGSKKGGKGTIKSASPKVSESLKNKKNAKSEGRRANRMGSLEKITKNGAPITENKQVSGKVTKSPKNEQAKVVRAKPASKGAQTGSARSTTPVSKAQTKKKTRSTKSSAPISSPTPAVAQKASRAKPVSSEKPKVSRKRGPTSVSNTQGETHSNKNAVPPSKPINSPTKPVNESNPQATKGKRGGKLPVPEKIVRTPGSARSTRSKGPAPDLAEAVQLALAETSSPEEETSVEIMEPATKKAPSNGRKGGKGKSSSTALTKGARKSVESPVNISPPNHDTSKVTTMVFETRVTRGKVTVTSSPANGSSKRKMDKEEVDLPKTKRGKRGTKKAAVVEDKANPAAQSTETTNVSEKVVKGKAGKPPKEDKQPTPTAKAQNSRRKSGTKTPTKTASGGKRKRGKK